MTRLLWWLIGVAFGMVISVVLMQMGPLIHAPRIEPVIRHPDQMECVGCHFPKTIPIISRL